MAEWLAAHPAVASVSYPGLASHPGHAVAARQMRGGFGAMLSFRLRDGEARAKAGGGQLKVFRQATSLGAGGKPGGTPRQRRGRGFASAREFAAAVDRH